MSFLSSVIVVSVDLDDMALHGYLALNLEIEIVRLRSSVAEVAFILVTPIPETHPVRTIGQSSQMFTHIISSMQCLVEQTEGAQIFPLITLS